MKGSGNTRIIRNRMGSLYITIPISLAMAVGIEDENMGEWVLFPRAEEDWQRIRREHPNALVLIPRG